MRNAVDAIGVEEICRTSSRKRVVTEELENMRWTVRSCGEAEQPGVGECSGRSEETNAVEKRGGGRKEEEHPGC